MADGFQPQLGILGALGQIPSQLGIANQTEQAAEHGTVGNRRIGLKPFSQPPHGGSSRLPTRFRCSAQDMEVIDPFQRGTADPVIRIFQGELRQHVLGIVIHGLHGLAANRRIGIFPLGLEQLRDGHG